ncbi:MAG: hypothetical protein JO257_13715 [Deltaproteobacteria bacterium]|nr:hypothetical protein [Deltaproteobacteria bacterium]
MTASRRDLTLALALAVLAALVFAPALGGPFIFDDHPLIEGNAQVHTLAAAKSWFTSDFWAGIHVPNRLHYWRPLISATYAIDWRLAGGAPLQFHITNTLAHVAVTLLAFVTLRRWTSQSWAAFAATAVWAIHPTKAENVAWIAGRTDVVCMLFLLVAAAGMARRHRGVLAAGLALEALGTTGAYMCKEQAVILPVFAAVEAWVALGRPPIDRAAVRPLLRAMVPQTAIAIAYVAIRAVVMPIASPATLSLANHVRAVLETYGRFLALTFAPHALSIQHALVRPHDGSFVYSTPYIALGALGFVATLAAIALLRRRAPAAAVGIAFWLATIAPTLNIAQTSQQTLVSERFLYVPTLGLALVLATVLVMLSPAARRRALLLLAAIGLALMAVGVSRAADFAEENAFWNRELRLHPDSSAGLDYVMTSAIQHRLLDQIADLTDRDKDQATFAADVLELFTRTVPDRDPTVLRGLDASTVALLAHQQPQTTLAAFGITVVVDMGPAFAIAPVEARIHAARAELAGRLGDMATARTEATAEAAACASCSHATRTRALVEARAAALGPPAEADAGFARALALLAPDDDELRARIAEARKAAAMLAETHGAVQLQARASELSALGLWGAAYKVLQPRFGEITMLSHATTSFAKLAFRAGETADAADALAAAMPATEVRTTLEGWARDFGWLPPVAAASGQ